MAAACGRHLEQWLQAGKSAPELAQATRRKDFPRLVAALVRVDIENGYEEVREAA